MHEMSICEGLLMAVQDAARTEGFTRVTRLRLEIGRFAGVEPDALRFGFDVVMKGSPAEDAELVLIEEPGAAWCFDCAETVPIADRLDPCPGCGGVRLRPTAGMDMRIKDMEVI